MFQATTSSSFTNRLLRMSTDSYRRATFGSSIKVRESSLSFCSSYSPLPSDRDSTSSLCAWQLHRENKGEGRIEWLSTKTAVKQRVTREATKTKGIFISPSPNKSLSILLIDILLATNIIT
jgi:hypothetical protein